jgi:hypothetical protein
VDLLANRGGTTPATPATRDASPPPAAGAGGAPVPAGGGAPEERDTGGAPAEPVVDVRAELARIAEWAHPERGTEATAQRALDALPRLRPLLTSVEDGIEADYYAATAAGMLGRTDEMCRALRVLGPRAQRANFMAAAVREALTLCP